jgi:hypothetical protein
MSNHRNQMVDTVTLGKRNRIVETLYRYGYPDVPIQDTYPRSRKGIHPSRNSMDRNMITPMRSGIRTGKPIVRAAESLSGSRKIQEAKASSRKAAGRHNRLDRGIPNVKAC